MRQPWAWAIIHGGKDVENRVRNLAGDYRGPVAIHAGLAKPEQGNLGSRTHQGARGSEVDTTLHFGGIIGLVDLINVHKGWAPSRNRIEHVGSCYRAGRPYGPCSRWAEPGAFHLEIEKPRALARPIPFTGALGLRTLPDDIAAAVLAGVTS